MANLENLKTLAKEVAKSDFLWELGLRVPSGNQARDICGTLSMPLADEKRVKAVLRLRELDPDALREIRDDEAGYRIVPDAADEGEERMAETIVGPDHLARIAREKDENLWNKIRRDLGISSFDALADQMSRLEVPDDERKQQMHLAEARLPRIAFLRINSHPWPYFITDLRLTDDRPGFRLCARDGNAPRAAVIRTFPTWLCQPYNTWSDERNALPYFYVDARLIPVVVEDTSSPSGKRWISGVRWADAVISVKDRRFQQLAQKLARAYEAETARRHKPAKAIVLKNY